MSKKKKKPLTRRQKNKRKLILFIVEIFVLLILLGVFWMAIKMSKINTKQIGDVNKNELDDETSDLLKDYTNIALLGLDNRTVGNYETGNADSIIIASINKDTKAVKLVSIYRDCYMQVTDDGTYSKANSAYARNHGAVGMMETLNRNLDLDIENYISVDWYALVKTINLLGGIDLEMTDKEATQVNKYMKDITKVTGYSPSASAYAGMNHADGVMALSYARIRKGVGDDFKRTERQREVIAKMVAKMKKAGVGTLSSIMDEVFPDIETSFSYTELLGLATAIFDYEITDTMGFPQDRDSKSMGSSGSCVIPVSMLTNVQQLHEFLFMNESYAPSVTVQQISNNIIYETGLAPVIEEETTETGTTSQ